MLKNKLFISFFSPRPRTTGPRCVGAAGRDAEAGGTQTPAGTSWGCCWCCCWCPEPQGTGRCSYREMTPQVCCTRRRHSRTKDCRCLTGSSRRKSWGSTWGSWSDGASRGPPWHCGGVGTSAACSWCPAEAAAGGLETWAGGSPDPHSERPASKEACGMLVSE